MWPVQIEALSTLHSQPPPLGIYGDIGVGGGKFLIATLAGAVLQAERPVVFTQPDLISQAHEQYDTFRELFPELADHRPRYVAYSTLSQTKHADLLDRLEPDVVVLDEAHAVAARDSARGLRLRRYVQRHPDTRVVILSGTLARKSLLDICDLAELALRDTMWLPIPNEVQDAWASLLDHGAKPGDEMLQKYLAGLVVWAHERGLVLPDKWTQETYQEAYRMRYMRTPGVIAPPETEVRASLKVRMWRPEAPVLIKETIKHLDETWMLPDGTELVDALEYWRHAATLSLGFYYRPIYTGETGKLQGWQDARLAWSRAVRRQINYIQREGVDSPANVEAACLAGTAHPDVIRAYWDWVAIREKVELTNETVWLTEELVDLAVARAREMGRGIVWYESQAVEDALRLRGFRVYGAGSAVPRPNVKLPALSRHVHGTGKNLQAWDRQIVLEPPASATPWEQLLGRTHRPGQLSDSVEADVLAATWITRSRIYAAIAEADFVARTSNKRYKLTFCDWVT